MKRFILSLVILFTGLNSYSQVPLSFTLSNVEATDCGPLMYSNIYAFKKFYWAAGSSSECTGENMVLLNGTDGITMTSDNFSMVSFQHINVVDPNGDPFTAGERGDLRRYGGGVMEIFDGGVLKLRLINCRITTIVPYPAPAGPATPVTGTAWGTINAAASDDAWENELDPGNTEQIQINFSSFSPVAQNLCGSISKYNFDVSFEPAQHREIINFSKLSSAARPGKNVNYIMNEILDFSDSTYIILNFASHTGGGENEDELDVYVNFIEKDPGGSVPDGIDHISDSYYWQIGTTLAAYSASITFDASNLPGITDISTIRILRRVTEEADWEIYADYTVSDGDIIANNVTAFSEWVLGSTDGANALPVELTSFTATTIDNKVQLNWQTATEVDNYGFQVERKVHSAESTGWEEIGFVNGHGNSNSVKEYSFVDNLDHNLSLNLDRKIYYRLKQIDTGGDFEYSNVVEVVFNLPAQFSLEQNFPNPFNPSTTINFSIPESGNVLLKIYDMLGRESAVLINETKTAGNYSIKFDAENLSSGIYFYTLKANGMTETKKMFLIR